MWLFIYLMMKLWEHMFKELNLFPKKQKREKPQQTDFNLLQSSCSFQQVTLINAAQCSLLPECQCFPHFLHRLLSNMIDMKRSKCSTDLFFPAGIFWLGKWAFKGTCDKHFGFEANWCLLMLHTDLHGLFYPESHISNCIVWLAQAHTNFPSCRIFVLMVSKQPLEPYTAALWR